MAANDDARPLDGQGLPPEVMDAIIQRASDLPDAPPPEPLDPGADLQEASQANIPTWQSPTLGAALAGVGLGGVKAGLELKDAVLGEPKPGTESDARKDITAASRGMAKDSALNGIAQAITQFGIGFIGIGKLPGVASGLTRAASAGRLAHWSAEAVRGAAAGYGFMDPHAERLSNLVEQYPALRNPVSAYLAAKPDDSAAEGRLKNALEGIVLDAGLSGALALAVKSIRLARGGEVEAANKVAAEADDAFAKAAAPAPSSPPATDLSITEAAQRVREMDLKPSGPTSDLRGESSGLNVAAADERRAGNVQGAASGDGGLQSGEPRAEGVENPVSSSNAGGDTLGTPLDAGSIQRGEREAASPGGMPGAGDGNGGPQFGLQGDGERIHPEVRGEQTSAGLEQLRGDTTALIQYGGRDAAIDAGHTFAPSPQTSGVIPWQKLQTTEQTQGWMNHLIQSQADYINARRGGNAKGVMSDADMASMLADRTKAWNEDPAEVLGVLKAAGDGAPQLATNMETSFLIANKAYQDSYELAQRIASDNLDGFGSRQEALGALQHRMAMATTMYANGKAIVSNAARSMRRMRGDFKFTPEQLANITTADPEQLLKVINETKGDPSLLAKASRITAAQRVVDWVASLQAANLLWGWKTQVVNAVTSAAMLVWRPLETGIGSYGLKAVAKYKGDEVLMANADSIRRQSLREVSYLGSMLSDGWNAAYKAFLEGDSILAPRMQEHFNATSLQADNLQDLWGSLRPMNTMEDVAANAVTASLFGKAILTGDLRVLGAADEMVKTLRYRAVVSAKASLEADERGLAPGTQAYGDYVSSRLDAAFDGEGRGIDPEALREAQASTFQNDYVKGDDTWLGRRGLGAWYANMSADQTWLRTITPFIKTPTNLFRYGVKLTPGVNMLQKEYVNAIRGDNGPEAAARAIGQLTLGTMLASLGVTLWARGALTGSPPQNPQQAKEWRKAGNKPYSLSWTNAEGGRSYFELNQFDPVMMPLIMAADTASIYRAGHINPEEPHGLAMSLVLAIANRLKDKTYLKSIADVIDATRDDHTMESWTKRTAPGFMPFSSLLAQVNPDPYLRETRTVLDSLAAKVPGLSSSLPPARDAFGDVVTPASSLVSTQTHVDPLGQALDESLAATGHYVTPPAAKSEATGGVDLRDFTLKDGRTAYDRYQELVGHPEGLTPLREMLSDLVQSDEYKDLPHGDYREEATKEGTMMDVVVKYRRAAFQALLAENPDLMQAVNKRKLDIADAVALGSRDPKLAADQARTKPYADLLKSNGITLPSVPVR
jgi:hypothetical protein